MFSPMTFARRVTPTAVAPVVTTTPNVVPLRPPVAPQTTREQVARIA